MIDGPDDITADWLTTALRATTPEVHVRSVEVEQIGTGQTGANFRLHLDADAGAGGTLPPTLVAKTAAGDRAQRERVQARATATRSASTPSSAIGCRSVRRARWHAEISDDSCSFVLLLDDLAPARPGVQVDGCSPDQAVDAVRNLAGLHAPVWNDVSLSDRREWLSTLTGKRGEFLGTIAVSAAEVFNTRYADELGDDVDTLRRSAELTGRWAAFDPGTSALVHGDYRLDNLMFPDAHDRAGAGVATVDWQTLAIGPRPATSRTSSPPACTSTCGARTSGRWCTSTSARCARSGSTTTRTTGASPTTGSACCRDR